MGSSLGGDLAPQQTGAAAKASTAADPSAGGECVNGHSARAFLAQGWRGAAGGRGAAKGRGPVGSSLGGEGSCGGGGHRHTVEARGGGEGGPEASTTSGRLSCSREAVQAMPGLHSGRRIAVIVPPATAASTITTTTTVTAAAAAAAAAAAVSPARPDHWPRGAGGT